VFHNDLVAAFSLAWDSVYSPYRLYKRNPSKYEVIGNIHDNPDLNIRGEGGEA
jgi:hypothetical protein